MPIRDCDRHHDRGLGNTISTFLLTYITLNNTDIRILLVRKRGTRAFMQVGGKIEAHETTRMALARELEEELERGQDVAASKYLGQYVSPATNETGHTVEAEIFFLRLQTAVSPAAEIEAVVWVDPFSPSNLLLAPLTRYFLLPIASSRLPKSILTLGTNSH